MLVQGARRVWGTLKATTPTAVKNTLQRLSTIGEGAVLVKRKYKTVASDMLQGGWFVVRGEEELLLRLQDEWPQIATQTAWKLEPLFSYDISNNTADNALPTSPSSPHSSEQSNRQVEAPATSQVNQPPAPSQPSPSSSSLNVTSHYESDQAGITREQGQVETTQSSPNAAESCQTQTLAKHLMMEPF